MIVEYNGHTLEIRRDSYTIDVMEEPDPNWVHVDAGGHVHRWVRDSLPTVLWVEDAPAIDDYPAEGHYQCEQCGDRITPGTRGPARLNVAGRTEYLLDGKSVTREELAVWGRENGLIVP